MGSNSNEVQQAMEDRSCRAIKQALACEQLCIGACKLLCRCDDAWCTDHYMLTTLACTSVRMGL